MRTCTEMPRLAEAAAPGAATRRTAEMNIGVVSKVKDRKLREDDGR